MTMRIKWANLLRGQLRHLDITNKRTLIYALFVWLVLILVIARPKSLKKNLSSIYSNIILSTRYAYNTGSHVTIDGKIKPSCATGIFVLLDSTKFNPNANVDDDITKWPTLKSALEDCQDVLQVTTCKVFLVFYADDARFSKPEVRDRVLLNVNKTARIGGKRRSGNESRVEYFIRDISDRQQEARLFSDVIKSAYLANVEYFYFILAGSFEKNGKPLRLSLGEMQNMLGKTEALDNVGVVLQTKEGSDVIGCLLVNKVHLEIFGEMFPYEITLLNQSLSWITAVYPGNLVHAFSITNSGFELKSAMISSNSNSILEIIEREKIVLERYLNVARITSCLRCDINKTHDVIAMSLYGSSPRYTMGALRNAQLLPIIFPKWRLWFYCEAVPTNSKPKFGNVPSEIIYKIKELGAEIRYVDTTTTGLAPMLWRFLVAEDPDVDNFTVRDCDSRLTPRDAAVVDDWSKTNKAFHCIRDHPSHSAYTVSGGLWGGRRSLLNTVFNGSLKTVMKKYGAGYVEDMNFLGADVWPKVKDNDAYCHDSFSCDKFPASHPFPVKRENFEHLGQVYDEHSIGREGDIRILRNANVNPLCTKT